MADRSKAYTTIRLKKTTLERLNDHTRKGHTHDEVINRLLDLAEKDKLFWGVKI